MSVKYIELPMDEKTALELQAGDNLMLSGYMYTGRDAAHQRLYELAMSGKPLPIDIKGQAIYYVGPAPAKKGYAVGSAGPTTSSRMDKFSHILLDMGLRVMIGKGRRSPELIESMKRNGAVYLGVIGGIAALVSRGIVKSELVAYEDLGPEAIYRFTVKDFPATVLIDSKGNNLYEIERAKYSKI